MLVLSRCFDKVLIDVNIALIVAFDHDRIQKVGGNLGEVHLLRPA